MKKLVSFLIIVFAFSVTLTYAGPAGPGHSHAPRITKEQAIVKASSIVDAIVKEGKLDPSWANVETTDAKKERFENRSEWVVTFKNPEEKDPAKKILYVFLNLHGQYLAANHIGK